MTTTPTTPWAHLPNAPHIDRILADLKARPEVWRAAWDAVWDAALGAARGVAWGAARVAALDAARDAARDAAWRAAWGAAWGAALGAALDAAWDAALDAALDAARDAAWDALLALIAWDDCNHLLGYTPDEVRALAAIGSPAATLLLPAVIALNS
jgi:hypothetical protein